jgi:hypothetical protein
LCKNAFIFLLFKAFFVARETIALSVIVMYMGCCLYDNTNLNKFNLKKVSLFYYMFHYEILKQTNIDYNINAMRLIITELILYSKSGNTVFIA